MIDRALIAHEVGHGLALSSMHIAARIGWDTDVIGELEEGATTRTLATAPLNADHAAELCAGLALFAISGPTAERAYRHHDVDVVEIALAAIDNPTTIRPFASDTDWLFITAAGDLRNHVDEEALITIACITRSRMMPALIDRVALCLEDTGEAILRSSIYGRLSAFC